MKRLSTLLLCLLVLCISLQASAQNRLVAVTYQKLMTVPDQFDALFKDYGKDLLPKDSVTVTKIAKAIKKISPDVLFVCLNYRTEDPSGKEVIASGLLALPEGRIKGVINVAPFCREKAWAPTAHKWTLESMPSVRGYAVLVPDTIGYGETADEVVPLLLSDNIALVSVHFRQAVEEFMQTLDKPRKLPAKTIFFGYSLGAAGALATAAYYHSHPELGIKAKTVYLGSGAYDPVLSIQSTVAAGESDYMLYPAIVRSLNQWKGLNLDKNQLFHGPILDDFDFVSSCDTDMTELAKVYGSDLHGYLHPDWFTQQKNPEINRLMDFLETLKVTVDRNTLRHGTKIYLRHSEEDRYVPIECTDSLKKELRRNGYSNVTYFRSKHGDHYNQGGLSVLDIFLMVL